MTGGAGSNHLKDARGWNRESAHTGTTAKLLAASGRGKGKSQEREGGREGERERGREGE